MRRRPRRNPTRYKRASAAFYAALKEAGVSRRDNLIAYRKTLDDLEIEYEEFLALAANKNPSLILMRLIDDRLQSYGEHILDAMPGHVVKYAHRLLNDIGEFTEDDLEYFVGRNATFLMMASNGSEVAKRRAKQAAVDLADTLLS